MHRYFLWAFCIVPAVLQAAEPVVQQTPQELEVRKYLLQAAELFEQVEESNDPNQLNSIWARERIQKHPLLYVTYGLTRIKCDDEALQKAKLIKEPMFQAFAMIRIADDQIDQGRLEAADKTFQLAVTFLKNQANAADLLSILQYPLSRSLLNRYQSVEQAEATAKQLGLDWKKASHDEQVLEIAKLLVNKGKLEEARKLLKTLPPNTFTDQWHPSALIEGTEFYEWIGRLMEDPWPREPDQLLLKWIGDESSIQLLQKFLESSPENSPVTYQALYLLAERYQLQKRDKELKSTLEKMKPFEDRFLAKLSPEKREPMEFARLVARREYCHIDLQQLFTNGKLQERYRRVPEIALLIPPLCLQHQPELAEEVAQGQKLDEQAHALLAIAWYEAKKPELAERHLEKLATPLARPRCMVGISKVFYKQGDRKQAQETLLQAIQQMEQIPSTDKWTTPGEIPHEQKRSALTYAHEIAAEQQCFEPLLKDPSQSISIRRLAMALGEKNDKQNFEKLLAALAARKDGSQTYALIGFTQGLFLNQDLQQTAQP